MECIVIYGAGGFAREVAWLAESSDMTVGCYIDDNPERHATELNGIPVVGLERARADFQGVGLIAAVGDPLVRQELVERALRAGFVARTLVHPETRQSRWVEIGEGTVVCAGNIFTTNIVIGQQCQINLDCTIGHDVVMGQFTTLAPGVHVSGCVQLGQRVYVGTGAVIINGTQDRPIVIEDNVVIGAGACVTKSVPAGTTVVGVPARPLHRD